CNRSKFIIVFKIYISFKYYTLFAINMKIFSILLFIATSLVISGCSSSNDRYDENAMADHHNSQNSLDWSGTYTGLLPCASCESIKTDLVLNEDMTYVLTTFYLGENGDEIVETGSFTWNDAGNTVVLDGLNDRPNQFFVGENMLFQLDMDGNRIAGDMADAYKLTRDMS